MSADVVTLEEDEELAKFAAPVLRTCDKLGRIFGVVGPLKDGAPTQAPFDVIFVNGSVAEIPQAWVQQLKEGGRMAVITVRGAAWERPTFACARVGRSAGGLLLMQQFRCFRASNDHEALCSSR